MIQYQYSRDYFEDDESLPTQIDDEYAKNVFFNKVSYWGDFVEDVKTGHIEVDDSDTGLWDIWLDNGEYIFTGRFRDYDDLKPYSGQQWKKHVVAFIWFNAFDTLWWVVDDKAFEMFSNDLDWFNE